MPSDESDGPSRPLTDEERVAEWIVQLAQFLSGGEGGVSLDRITRENAPSLDQTRLLISDAKDTVTVFSVTRNFGGGVMARIARTIVEIQKLNHVILAPLVGRFLDFLMGAQGGMSLRQILAESPLTNEQLPLLVDQCDQALAFFGQSSLAIEGEGRKRLDVAK